MNVRTEILRVIEKRTNYRQQDMCMLTPGQRGAALADCLLELWLAPWTEKLGLPPRHSAWLQSDWLLALRHLWCERAGSATVRTVELQGLTEELRAGEAMSNAIQGTEWLPTALASPREFPRDPRMPGVQHGCLGMPARCAQLNGVKAETDQRWWGHLEMKWRSLVFAPLDSKTQAGAGRGEAWEIDAFRLGICARLFNL